MPPGGGAGAGGFRCGLGRCRPTGAAGRWHSTGGYAVIAEQLFPRLAVDALLLEYDSDRSGDFAPLACVPSGVVAVLGLLTTKTGDVISTAVVDFDEADLMPGDVTVAIDYSTVNYKDAMAVSGHSPVIRQFPLTVTAQVSCRDPFRR